LVAIASRETVARYIERHYVLPPGETGAGVVERHADRVDHDASMRSFDYWTGDAIAEAEGLAALPTDDEGDGDDDDERQF
jgi:hypothetical protein